MPYERQYGTTVWWERKYEHGTAACPRCGLRRKVHTGDKDRRTGLCRDCHEVLTEEEVEFWKDPS